MTASCRVSIGMPAYNRAPSLARAIESVLGQTMPDLELIISDNASTDETEAICRRYAAADPRIRYTRHREPIGGFPNFRFVLDAARAPYFMWLPPDDYALPRLLERAVAVLDAHPDVVVLRAADRVSRRRRAPVAGGGNVSARRHAEREPLALSSGTRGTTRASTVSTAARRCVASCPSSGYHAFDWTVSVGTLLAGKHWELDEVLLVREASDPTRYTKMIDLSFSNPLARLLPLLPFTRAALFELRVPPRPSTLARLFRLNLVYHVMYCQYRYPRYGDARVHVAATRRARDGRALAQPARHPRSPNRMTRPARGASGVRRARHGRSADQRLGGAHLRAGGRGAAASRECRAALLLERAGARTAPPPASTSSTFRVRAPGWPAPATWPPRCSVPGSAIDFRTSLAGERRLVQLASPLLFEGARRAGLGRFVLDAHNVYQDMTAFPQASLRDRVFYRLTRRRQARMEAACWAAAAHVIFCSTVDRDRAERLAPGIAARSTIVPELRGHARVHAASRRGVRRRGPGGLHRHHALSAELLRRTGDLSRSGAGAPRSRILDRRRGAVPAGPDPRQRALPGPGGDDLRPARRGPGGPGPGSPRQRHPPQAPRVLRAPVCPWCARPSRPRGWTIVDGTHVRLAETPAALVAAIRDLHGDARASAALGASARALVETRYDWRAWVPGLLQVYVAQAPTC